MRSKKFSFERPVNAHLGAAAKGFSGKQHPGHHRHHQWAVLSIPSHLFPAKKEAYYHSVIFLVFQYLGQYIEAEVHTSDGRIDAIVVKTTPGAGPPFQQREEERGGLLGGGW